MRNLVLGLLLLFSAAPTFGEDNAITQTDHIRGFKISDVAAQTIGLKTAPLTAPSGRGSFPKSALVFFQGKVGVYRVRDGWYKLLDVQILSKDKETFTVKVEEPKVGDRLVTEGVALLRVADLDASGGEEEGHGH